MVQPWQRQHRPVAAPQQGYCSGCSGREAAGAGVAKLWLISGSSQRWLPLRLRASESGRAQSYFLINPAVRQFSPCFTHPEPSRTLVPGPVLSAPHPVPPHHNPSSPGEEHRRKQGAHRLQTLFCTLKPMRGLRVGRRAHTPRPLQRLAPVIRMDFVQIAGHAYHPQTRPNSALCTLLLQS
jgi:hypothetical protein